MKRFLSFFLALVTVFSLAATALPATVSADFVSGYYRYTVSDGEATITDVDTAISGDVVVPETLGGCPVTIIGTSAFEECDSLVSVRLPSSLREIYSRGFYGCSNLTTVVIAEGVNYISDYAFGYCSALKDITIPSTTEYIGYAFSGTTGLRVHISDLAAWCNIAFSGNPLSQAEGLYINGEKVTTLVIPAGVDSVSRYAFYGYTALETLILPASLQSIDPYAFYGCQNLETVWFIGGQNRPDEINFTYDNDPVEDAAWHYVEVPCIAACEDCGIAFPAVSEHTYYNNCDPVCFYCGQIRTAPHYFSDVCDKTCNECGTERIPEHSYNKPCDEDCDLCGTLRTTQHSYSGGVCTVCGKTYVSTNGWVQENGIWVFYQNGSKLFNCWMEDSKGWCYLTHTGAMATNAWVPDSVGLCYVGPEGYCLTNQWFKDANGWVYLNSVGRKTVNAWVKDSKGWCYVGTDGYMLYNQWVADSKGWVYVDKSGYMVTNAWVKASDGWYFVNKNGYCMKNCWMKDSKGWCWLGSNGRMATNQWVKDSKGWCYVDESGYCVTNCFKQDSVGWCYLDKEGSMVKNKWLKVGNLWYYMNANGYRHTGWLQQGGKWYYMNPSTGTMVTEYQIIDGKAYYFNSNGTMKANTTFGKITIGSDGWIRNSSFSYMAADDFKYYKRTYPSAVAQYGYVYAYKDYNGHFQVMTVVYFRVGQTLYYGVRLHNMLSGAIITNPYDYYMSYASYSSTYRQLALEANRMQDTAVSHGAYVSAAYLTK